MKRLLAVLCFLLLLAALSAALGEPSVTFSPEKPRMGDYVDVTVTPGREDPTAVTYELTCNGEKVSAGTPDRERLKNPGVHLNASFRPRLEGTYTLRVTVTYGKDDLETAEVLIPVAGIAPEQAGPDVLYSQKDGWWYRKWYAKSAGRDLQKAGCAIFTLSHLLQRMGFSGEDVLPEKLGKMYSGFYTEGKGTFNQGVINRAAKEYNFVTQRDLLSSAREIAVSLRMGDLFSFGIVDGHIALANGISADGTKVHVVDSAPGATFDRIDTPGSIFFMNEDGTFTEAASPGDLPGIRWFFETMEYGGMEYWMSVDYCAKRGLRLVRIPWVRADLGEGLDAVTVDYAGTLMSKVTREKESMLIPTRKLTVHGAAAQVVMVTAKDGTPLLDGNGKVLKVNGQKKQVKRQAMALLLAAGEDLHYVSFDGVFAYLPAKDTEILPAAQEDYKTGIIIKNKNTSGALQITVYLKPDGKSTGLAVWKTGTPVAVLEKQESFYLVEGLGRRGWVPEQYVKLDVKEETEGSPKDGQKIDEGK